MASSSASHNNIDLNAVPDVQPEVWRPSFTSPRGHLMTTDTVMLDDAVAVSVARGIILPRDQKLLADRSDDEAISDSMLSAFGVPFLFQTWLDVCRFGGVRFNLYKIMFQFCSDCSRNLIKGTEFYIEKIRSSRNWWIRTRMTWGRGTLIWSRIPIVFENSMRISCLKSRTSGFYVQKLSQVFYLI